MSDTPETDALREAIDNGAATEAEMTSLSGKFERERDEAREARNECERQFQEKVEEVIRLLCERDEAFGALAAQDKKMEVAGKQCGIPFEVFGCDWPDRVAEELIAVAKERDEARRGIRLMAQNAEVWKERADQARRELDIQIESIKFHMDRKDEFICEKKDSSKTLAECIEDKAAYFDSSEELRKARAEREEAREALRVLFNDYKELADSGDAGFWELEDKEAAQPALRIFQQMDATNPTTKSKQVSSKLVVIKTASNL